jgi:hypothetical protein
LAGAGVAGASAVTAVGAVAVAAAVCTVAAVSGSTGGATDGRRLNEIGLLRSSSMILSVGVSGCVRQAH